MRKVSIRQFQQNFHKELKDIPFEITRKGETVAFVVTKLEDRVIGRVDVEAYIPPVASTTPCDWAFIEQGGGCAELGAHPFNLTPNMQDFGKRNLLLCLKHFNQLR